MCTSKGMQLEPTLTCPACGHQATETMPSGACRCFYDCGGRGARSKPGRLLRIRFLWERAVPAGPRDRQGRVLLSARRVPEALA